MAFNYSSGAIKISSSIQHVKVPLYNGNGGRDTYIACNAGGNSALNMPSTQGMSLLSSNAIGSGTLYVGKDQCDPRKDIFPVNGQRRVTYSMNGSGRDTYIGQNNGGFHPRKQVAEYKLNFVDQLRSESNLSTATQQDYMVRRNLRMRTFLEKQDLNK